MTDHTHTEYVDGCYRCDLARDEIPSRCWEVTISLDAAVPEDVMDAFFDAIADVVHGEEFDHLGASLAARIIEVQS